MSWQALREAVFTTKPGLRAVVERNSTKPVLSYALERPSRPMQGARQEECLSTIVDLVTQLHGSEVGRSVEQALGADWYVSTAEHHAPITHPFVVSGTFTQSLVQQRRGFGAQVVLSSGSISLNNSSFPRGWLFHDARLAQQRISFLPWRFRQQPVVSLPPLTFEQWRQVSAMAQAVSPRLVAFLATKYDALIAARSYADQVSVLNEALWRQMPGQKNMHLVYISQEALVAELLVRYHLHAKTVVHSILFDSAWRQSYGERFVGLVGAHSADGQQGTVLFWAVRGGRRVALRLRDGGLVSADGRYQIALTPGVIGLALESGELLPNMALVFITLCFYYGLSCGGGFSQVDYLPRLRLAYEQMCRDHGVITEVTAVTDFLSSDYAFVALQTKQQSVLATGLDMFLYGEAETNQRIHELAETTTLAAALDNLLPEFYAITQGESYTGPLVSAALPTCLYVSMPVLRQ